MVPNNDKQIVDDELHIITEHGFIETIIYWLLFAVGWIYGYITLIPYFLKHGRFKNIYLDDIPSICVYDGGNEEKIYRKKSSLNKLVVGFPTINLLSDVIKYSNEFYKDRQCLGRRRIITKTTHMDNTTGRLFKKYHLGEYEWKSYNEVKILVDAFKNGLLNINIWNSDQTPKIAIFAKNSEEWIISELGVLATNSILVTIFSNMDDNSIAHAINQTKPSVLIVDKKSYIKILNMIDNIHTPQSIIVIGKNVKKYDKILEKNIQIWTYYEIIELNECAQSYVYSCTIPCPDDVAVIMYTSGSTGLPKGVCLTHKNIITTIGSVPKTELTVQLQTTPSYLPCAHTLGFAYVMVAFIYGYRIGHCRPLTLFDTSPGVILGTKGDFPELKPTVSFVVPLIIDRLVKSIIANIKTKSRYIQFVLNFALDYKLYFLEIGHNHAPIIDKFLFKKIRDIIGGELHTVCSGGGPISRSTSLVFSALFDVNLQQVYGATESFGGGTFTDLDRPVATDVGPVSPTVEIKLVPWAEGNYYPDDKPNPRGEICIHGACIADGYYKLEKETNKRFYIDDNNKRWFVTGDIGEYLSNGNFSIIDRKVNIIKLINGEFISLTKIETYIYNSDFVELCCCVPSSKHDSLIAIINPKIINVLTYLESHNIPHQNHNSEIDIKDKKIQQIIIDDIQTKLKKLNRYERPSKYIIVTDLWTPENELLTSVLKIRRHKIKKFYQHLLL